MSDVYKKSETFLVLKYGSVHNAYKAWMLMTLEEQYEIDNIHYEIIMDYEYRMQTAGMGNYR